MGKTKGRPIQVSPQTIAMTAEAIKQIRLMGAYGRRATISRLAVRLHFNTKSMTNVRHLVNRLESQGVIRVKTQQPYEESILVLLEGDYDSMGLPMAGGEGRNLVNSDCISSMC